MSDSVAVVIDPIGGTQMTQRVPEAMRYITVDELKLSMRRGSKFHNVPTEVDGIRFDSRKEMRRYVKLKAAQDAGVISNLEVHPLYRMEVRGVELEVFRYTPDFRYVRDGQVVVEDVKSKPTKTEAYAIRKRLMRALYGIEIQEW